MRWLAEAAWTGGPELTSDVLIEEERGVFTSVAPGERPDAVRLDGVVLPGLVNTHSHAFHRLLRGKTHRRGGDFWLWRDLMYETAASLTPTGYERIATAVFVEMALAGITNVGEFHYVHNQPGGAPYADANEMGHALIRAAGTAGIRICLLDAGYFAAGFGNDDLSPVQLRFRDMSPESWLERATSLAAAHDGSLDVRVGLAPHSVRAVPSDALRFVGDRRDATLPLHVHVSEQPSENRDCLEATGVTPTTLLDDCGLLGETTTLIHATHVTDADISLVGAASARVCYCATTERDLGDGIGPAASLAVAGAGLCVGSDSHAVIDLFEEARGVELHQRLLTGRRGLLSAEELIRAATVEGSRALGGEGGLRQGAPADFIVVDPDTPRMAGVIGEHGLDGVVFAATAADVRDVYVGGRQIVSNRSHPEWESRRHDLISD